MALHSQLTGSELHEPKGVTGAAVGTVYIADGAGSGSWTKTEASDVSIEDTNGFFTATTVEGALNELYERRFYIEGLFNDVSTNSTILLPVPFDCEILQINMILGGSITSADSTVTVTRSDGAAMGTQVIAFSGSAEGTTFVFVPTGNEDFTYASHKYIKLVTDGNSTTAQPLYVQAHIRRT